MNSTTNIGRTETQEQGDRRMEEQVASGEREYRQAMLEDPPKPFETVFEPEGECESPFPSRWTVRQGLL